MNKKKLREFWEKLFPLKEGQKIILLKDTKFITYGKKEEEKLRVIKKGTIGKVVSYQEGHILVTVDFNIPYWNHILERKRVKRIG